MPDSTPLSTMKVFHLPGAWGLPTVSPFCLKLDAWLRMTGIQHESRTVATPFAGPKSKAPWIQIDGTKLGDSTFIIAYLTERFGIDPDEQLTAEQRGMAVAIPEVRRDLLRQYPMVTDLGALAHDAALIGGDWLISATQQLKLELEQAARAASEASRIEP
jgi:glutathione S-transferase